MMKRQALTLIEVILAIVIMALILALSLPVLQKSREASNNMLCKNNLRQLGIAASGYHSNNAHFPPSVTTARYGDHYFMLSWLSRILPWIDQEQLFNQIRSDFQFNSDPLKSPRHKTIGQLVKTFACPSDPDSNQTYKFHSVNQIAFTSYHSNMGSNSNSRNGVIFLNSKIRSEIIFDGMSNTLLAGERPSSPEKRFGWWYIGTGQDGTGSLDYSLGTQELNKLSAPWYQRCGPGPFPYVKPGVNSFCGVFQFWSDHPGGTNFVFCDGSVRFIKYGSDAVLKSIGTTHGSEIVLE
jgi:prepilin-type processing-associated H-X9-DG protein